MKYHFACCLAILFAFATYLPARTASAAVYISMVGTVEEGTLNSTNLAGSLFVYEAFVFDTADIDDVFPDTGTFVVADAQLSFGANGIYDFGNQPGYFNWGISGDQFYAYSVLNVDVPSSTYTDGFGFSSPASALSGFEPSQLDDFGPFDQFDQSWTYDTAPGPFTANNGLGDTLVLSQLDTFGILTVAAVPEPASWAIGVMTMCGLCLRRRREARSDSR